MLVLLRFGPQATATASVAGAPASRSAELAARESVLLPPAALVLR